MEDFNWIYVVLERHNWRAVVNMVMKLQVPQNAGNFLTS
jgi:hypothetical protein